MAQALCSMLQRPHPGRNETSEENPVAGRSMTTQPEAPGSAQPIR